MYNNFKKARAKQRNISNSKISDSMRGIKTRTARLVFDLSRKNGDELDISKNAAVKAMELVSSLLANFDLPAKPKLEYQGIIKNAMDNDGIMSDGIIRVGASINTLMGHKAHIDIPVLVRNRSLLEPAVFFFNDAPYVMCGPAIDELVRSGSLMKELQPRRIFSGPMTDIVSTVDKPRTPIINLQHMFSPGVRNPWTFKRYSQKKAVREPRKRTNIDTPTEMPEIWSADLPQQELDQAERTREGLIPVGSKVKLTKDYEVRNRGGGTLIIPSGEEGCVIRDEKGDGMCMYVDFCEMGVKDVIPYKFLKKADVTTDQIRKHIQAMLREGYQSVDIKAAIKEQYPEHAEEALAELEA